MTVPTPEPVIDRYLDDFAWALTTDPATTRRILAESEQHVLESTERRIADGIEPSEAALVAIAAFGAPTLVARRFAESEGRLPLLAALPQLALAALLIAGILGLAMGLGGILAALAGWRFGLDFVSGTPGIVYSAGRCADFLSFHPEASNCTDAATAHHFDELLNSRLGFGVAGLLALALYAGGHRWFLRWRSRPRAVPLAIVPATAGGILAIVTLLELGLTLSTLAVDREGSGLGAHLANLPVTVTFAAANGVWLLHSVRAARAKTIS